MAKHYCWICDMEVSRAWHHSQTVNHNKNAEKLVPLPPSPWAPAVPEAKAAQRVSIRETRHVSIPPKKTTK